MDKGYRVVCYMRIDCDESEIEPMTLEEASEELEHQQLMQPENRYEVEEVE